MAKILTLGWPKNLEAIDTLVAAGANLDVGDERKNCLLCTAIFHSKPAALLMVRLGADVNKFDSFRKNFIDVDGFNEENIALAKAMFEAGGWQTCTPEFIQQRRDDEESNYYVYNSDREPDPGWDEAPEAMLDMLEVWMRERALNNRLPPAEEDAPIKSRL